MVTSAEIPIADQERDRVPQVLDFLGESKSQAREAAVKNADVQILPLDMGSANEVNIRLAQHWRFLAQNANRR